MAEIDNSFKPGQVDETPPTFSFDWLSESKAKIYDFDKLHNAPEQIENTPKTNEKVEGRFETADLEQAVQTSKDKNIPFVVQVGASWCHFCQNMEKNIWPQVEGKDGLPEKAVILHLDYDESASFDGKAAELAGKLKEGVKGFPTLKIFNPGMEGQALVEHSGALSVDKLKDFLKSGGVKI